MLRSISDNTLVTQQNQKSVGLKMDVKNWSKKPTIYTDKPRLHLVIQSKKISHIYLHIQITLLAKIQFAKTSDLVTKEKTV